MSKKLYLFSLTLSLSICSILFGKETNNDYKDLTLKDCIKIALSNNKTIPIAEYDVKIAQAQHNQAKSAYWPQLDLTSTFSMLDQDPLIVNPASTMQLGELQLGAIAIQPPPIEVPEQNIKLADNNTLITKLELMYPLYTGGKISSINDQVRAYAQITQQSKRKTDLQVIYDIKKVYHATKLSQRLYEIGKEALDRLKVTLELTEKLYKEGSGTVTKIDFLKNSIVVENVRSILSRLKDNYDVAKSALKFTMGIDLNAEITLTKKEKPFSADEYDLDDLFNEAVKSNPQIAQVREGKNFFNAKIDEAQSGYFPKLALFGNYMNIANSYEYGIVTEQNRNTWMVGVGLNMSLFNGFRTANKVDQAELGLKQTQSKEALLLDGIAMQIRKIHSNLTGAIEREKSARLSMEIAIENRDLNERAYQNDLAEVQDLIESQIIESFMKAQYQMALFEYADLKAQLEQIIGIKSYE